jgi:ribosomal protein S18 acetylase RimI-like enzyme
MSDLNIRAGRAEDLDAMLALLPRLADFPLPPGRAPEDTYQGDGKTLKAWAKGEEPQCRVTVAEDGAGLLGFTLVRLQPEFMSGAPSAHLEVIIIDPRADGTGLGKTLLERAEAMVVAEGAQSMTLHVFANNERARSVYDRFGYSGELLRYVKRFSA